MIKWVNKHLRFFARHYPHRIDDMNILNKLRLRAFTGRRNCRSAGDSVPKIGIPRALLYYLHPGLWECFFSRLGCEVIISGETNRRTLETASLISESEHCLPVKIFDAHISELIPQVDIIFAPRILSTAKGLISCPKMGAIPDSALAQFGHQVKILTIDIDERSISLEDSLRRLGEQLNIEPPAVGAATRESLHEMKATMRLMNPVPSGESGKVLLLGHPYNLHMSHISGAITDKLKSMGVPAVMVDYSREPDPSGSIKWDTCALMRDELIRLDPAEYSGAIQLSSFNCGCDSMVTPFYRDILREKGIPLMTLIIDEHTGRAGLETRLEAFMDSIQAAR